MTIYDLGWMIADCQRAHRSPLARRASEGRPADHAANHPSSFIHHPSARRGISLLEVLISMFIMMVGLLGVAALIPVGRLEVQRGAQADRASACGRAAMRELKVRGILNPSSWSTINGNAIYNASTNQISFDGGTTFAATFPAVAIDPLAITDSGNNGLRSFPFDAGGSPPLVATPPAIPRITLGPGMTDQARLAMSDILFRWQDDLNFSEPTSATALPSQVLQGGTKRLSQGDYTWLATIVPESVMVTANNLFEVPMRVSVAVFFKRPLNQPGLSDRMCTVQLTGYSEVTLGIPDTALFPPFDTTGKGPAYLDFKPGQWLMLAGEVDRNGDPNSNPPGDRFWQYRWYRIVNADAVIDDGGNVVTPASPGNGTSWSRIVTIAGPDWVVPPAFQADFNNSARAFIFDGVVAVYEQTIKLERDSIYAN